MDKVTPIAAKENKISIGKALISGVENSGKLTESEIHGDNPRDVLAIWTKGFTISSDSLIIIDCSFCMFTERIHPTSLPWVYRSLVPYLVEIVEVWFTDGDNRITIIDGEDREVTAILRKCIRHGADGTTTYLTVKAHNTVRGRLQRIGCEMLFKEPRVSIGRGLYRAHVVPDTLCHSIKHTVSTLRGFLTDKMSRLEV